MIIYSFYSLYHNDKKLLDKNKDKNISIFREGIKDIE